MFGVEHHGVLLQNAQIESRAGVQSVLQSCHAGVASVSWIAAAAAPAATPGD